jgi:hypothetical protein
MSGAEQSMGVPTVPSVPSVGTEISAEGVAVGAVENNGEVVAAKAKIQRGQQAESDAQQAHDQVRSAVDNPSGAATSYATQRASNSAIGGEVVGVTGGAVGAASVAGVDVTSSSDVARGVSAHSAGAAFEADVHGEEIIRPATGVAAVADPLSNVKPPTK